MENCQVTNDSYIKMKGVLLYGIRTNRKIPLSPAKEADGERDT